MASKLVVRGLVKIDRCEKFIKILQKAKVNFKIGEKPLSIFLVSPNSSSNPLFKKSRWKYFLEILKYYLSDRQRNSFFEWTSLEFEIDLPIDSNYWGNDFFGEMKSANLNCYISREIARWGIFTLNLGNTLEYDIKREPNMFDILLIHGRLKSIV